MSCDRCVKQSAPALSAAGLSARLARGAWAGKNAVSRSAATPDPAQQLSLDEYLEQKAAQAATEPAPEQLAALDQELRKAADTDATMDHPAPVEARPALEAAGIPPAAAQAATERLQDYELSEAEYLQKRLEARRRSYQCNIARAEADLAALSPRALKPREDLESSIRFWRRALEQSEQGAPEGWTQGWREQYVELVRKAISTGHAVPAEVIAQRPEFAKARTARERYEKGRHTSFANRSAMVNDTMQAQRGYKCKRQDGKSITEAQMTEIASGFDEIESVLGPVGDVMRAADVTVAHTSGKHPFLSDSGGQYCVNEKTISVGVTGTASLAHEFAHWLDYEAGARAGRQRTCYRSRSRMGVTSSLAETDLDQDLIRRANRSMTDCYSIRYLLRRDTAQMSPEERDQHLRLKFKLGAYWHRPDEIFARLAEQYVQTRLGRSGVSVDADYERQPGWWSAETFKELEPLVETEIKRRLDILRQSHH